VNPAGSAWLHRKVIVYFALLTGLGVPILIFALLGFNWKSSVYWGFVVGFAVLSTGWCSLVLGFPGRYVNWIRGTEQGAPDGALRVETWVTSFWGNESDNYRGLRRYGVFSLFFTIAVVGVLVTIGVQISL